MPSLLTRLPVLPLLAMLLVALACPLQGGEKAAKDAQAKKAQQEAKAKHAAKVKQVHEKAKEEGPRAYGRFVPERLDDIAWENDRIAFRIYGPALQKHVKHKQSGIDVWVKRVEYPIIDLWYTRRNYHHDHGEGLDGYGVGGRRGCGGLGIWDGEALHVSDNFASWKFMEEGPERVRFEVRFDEWAAGDRTVSEVRTFELARGCHLNRLTSVLSAEGEEPLVVGVGLAKHGGIEAEGAGVLRDAETGILALWEPLGRKHGWVGCGVLVPPERVVGFTETKKDFLILVKVEPGKPWTYHAGAGWNKSGRFASREDWFAYMREAARLVKEGKAPCPATETAAKE